MIIFGISSGFHDAAITVIANSNIVFAAHSERYSKQKNDPFLNREMIAEALTHGFPEVIVLHEDIELKRQRQQVTGQTILLNEPTQTEWIAQFYPQLNSVPIKHYSHHDSHAAGGIFTSNFKECAVMVIDAIGEEETATFWRWRDNKLTKEGSEIYPNSLGLFYSAMTARVGLKPMEDEYILMGMAGHGDPARAKELSDKIGEDLFKNPLPLNNHNPITTKINMHKGLDAGMYNEYSNFDIASATQHQLQERVVAYAKKAKEMAHDSDNLVFMGGCALNCVANSLLFDAGFKNIHIMPNPGDAGSSLGCAAMEYYNWTGKSIKWKTPYLGHNIEGDYPIQKALDSLEKNEIFGIANGRAEFGPRALGNRSLMADPRGNDIKDTVNAIKHRQEFRPFAPVILAEHVDEYFEMPNGIDSPYMQFVAKCKHPDKFPAIVHVDGTSRVQTVRPSQHPALHELLSKFYEKTGCPMLLNTSLNIKGQPIVNDEGDAAAFAEKYNIPVHTSD